ncbi:MAG: aldehyde dehydrogenase family protein [Actinobacteria bacterium]|jgi:succinate-semialdehyde dehydrogenase/glutarate-semialdehyde dehydrogenase|nr:aldehyde dehydrogenase family protein [Actinomycetota bacterium]
MATTELRLLVADDWVEGIAQPLPLHSPVTGEVVALVHQADAGHLDRAVDAAWEAHHKLARMTAFERAALTHRVADLIEERAGTIARDLSAEHGKPMVGEALPEVAAAVEMFRDAAEGIKRLETSVIPSSDPAKRVITIRQPRGVYGLLTPWNFPVTIPSEYLSAGLATGNGMVWKPSELTPTSAAHLAQCFLDAGVPAGTLNLLHGDPAEIGGGIAGHERVVAVGLTGSSRTGQAVAARAAGKPLLFELGGNCPVIVFDDADLDTVVEKLAFGCFANAGQICDSVERILVHERIQDDLVAGLAEAASRLRLGSPFDESTTLGPVINEAGAARIDAHLADATDRGATVVMGGGRAGGHPTALYYQPTVVAGIRPGMRIEAEETFGPVAAVMAVEDEQAAVEAANRSSTGLVGAVFTRDIGRAMRVAEALETGMVNINDSTAYWQPHTPFGGFSGKNSGIGRLGGRWTLEEMTQIKTINLDVS